MISSNESGNIARKTHLLFVNYYFPPMGGGGVQRITKFLKYLDYSRFKVTVLTVKPSYFYSTDASLSAEIPPGVRVVRSGSLDPFRVFYLLRKVFRRNRNGQVSDNESGRRMRRMASAIFVPDSRLLWLPFALLKIWRLQRAEPVDFIIASLPPFTSGLIGALSRRRKKPHLLLDFRDAWTNNPYLPPSGRLQALLNSRIESYCIGRADGILFVNPSLERYYLERYPKLRGIAHRTIRNGYDEDDFSMVAKSALPANTGRFILGQMGTVYSQGNRPHALIQAVAELIAEREVFRNRFQLVFLGKWSPDFVEHVGKAGIADVVEWIPYRPHREALDCASRFSALTLTIESSREGSSDVTPGRIYEYLRLGKPILAICPEDSDLAFLVRDADAGEVVKEQAIGRIKQVLSRWIDDPASAADYRFTCTEKYSRSSLAGELMAFFGEVGSKGALNPRP